MLFNEYFSNIGRAYHTGIPSCRQTLNKRQTLKTFEDNINKLTKINSVKINYFF